MGTSVGSMRCRDRIPRDSPSLLSLEEFGQDGFRTSLEPSLIAMLRSMAGASRSAPIVRVRSQQSDSIHRFRRQRLSGYMLQAISTLQSAYSESRCATQVPAIFRTRTEERGSRMWGSNGLDSASTPNPAFPRAD